MEKVVKTVIAVPSYKGPHVHCWGQQLMNMFRLGRIAEQSPVEGISFQFGLAEAVGNSMIGQARDTLVSRALEDNADYIFFFDDDMVFSDDAFLRLWKHEKPWVGALAFTARTPIAPCLFKFKRSYDWGRDSQRETLEVDLLLDYPKNRLVRVDAMGLGVVLIQMEVFRKIPPPWFYGSVGLGEDIYFCWKMSKAGIPVYCDTSVKTMHAPNEPVRWHDELLYDEQKEITRAFHEARKASDNRHSDLQECQTAH